MKRSLLKYFTCGAVVLFFGGVIAYHIGNSIEVNEMEFKDYPSMSNDSGVKTWLPAFFPKNSENIYFYSNLDLNKFGVKFFLDNDNSHNFNSKLVDAASLDGEEYIRKEDELVSKVWCKTEINMDGDEVLYLIGNHKDNNVYYLTNVPLCRNHEYTCTLESIKIKRRLCN